MKSKPVEYERFENLLGKVLNTTHAQVQAEIKKEHGDKKKPKPR